MAVVNIRVDDRLTRGQVVAVWSLVTKANRIMMAGDLVVKDVVDKEALKMAYPQQYKLSILIVEKAAENLKAGRYDEERIFVVAKNPRTIRGLLDRGFQMKAVSVGNMDGKQNTKMLKKAVSVSQENIGNFLYLTDHGMRVTAQMVPMDEALNFVELIKKAEA